MRIVFKIASFALFSTTRLLLHIKIRYGHHQRRTCDTSSLRSPKTTPCLLEVFNSTYGHTQGYVHVHHWYSTIGMVHVYHWYMCGTSSGGTRVRTTGRTHAPWYVRTYTCTNRSLKNPTRQLKNDLKYKHVWHTMVHVRGQTHVCTYYQW
jgi:hypothetical protein